MELALLTQLHRKQDICQDHHDWLAQLAHVNRTDESTEECNEDIIDQKVSELKSVLQFLQLELQMCLSSAAFVTDQRTAEPTAV